MALFRFFRKKSFAGSGKRRTFASSKGKNDTHTANCFRLVKDCFRLVDYSFRFLVIGKKFFDSLGLLVLG